MANVSLVWYSSDCLPCKDTVEAPVVICVDSQFVESPDCPVQDDIDEPYAYGFIEGIISSAVKIKDACNKSERVWKYVLTYDDVQLVADVQLTAEDIIQVFCKDCLTTYIDSRAGNEVYLRNNDDGSLTLVSQHGCEYTFWPGVPPG